MTARSTPTRFSLQVREEMGRQNLSIRGLARRIDPANVDRARRNLHRWLDEGITPSRASRAEVEVALGLESSSLADDEEEDAVAALMRGLRALVRETQREQVRS